MSEQLPARTTPTWETEILLSGATVFALFQLYDGVHRGVYWLTERLPVDVAGSLAPLGLYLQGGVLALALGFLAHLALRAVWVSAVGLKSVDPEGRTRESPTLGPAQRELFGRRWDALPSTIAALDDYATLVFGLAIGLAKMMLVLFLLAGFSAAAAAALLLVEGAPPLSFGFTAVLMLVLAPMLVAVAADNRARRKGRPAAPWVHRVVGVYSALGFTSDRNLALQAFTYRTGGASNLRSQLVVSGIIVFLMLIAVFVPLLQHRGVGAMLAPGFPAFRAADAGVVRAAHYLDRVPAGAALRLPALPSAQVRGPYAALWIPYVAEWHRPVLDGCTPEGESRWLADATASRAVLDCLARAQPLQLNGKPLAATWWWSEDQHRDRRGFEVMIDVRALAPGAQLLEVGQPPAARAMDDDDSDAPWRIPFWT